MDNNIVWLIWSNEHEGWWRPKESGYTDKRADAGRYTFEQAQQIVTEANRYQAPDAIPNEAMIPTYE